MDQKRLRNNLIFTLPLLAVTPLLMIAIGIPPILALFLFAVSFFITLPMIGGMYWLHQRSFQGKAKAKGNTSVEQVRSVEVDLPLDQAYDLAEEAVNSLTGTELPMLVVNYTLRAKIRHKASSRAERRLIATTRTRWGILSSLYDEMRIAIHLTPVDANTTRIEIKSEPRLPTALVDFAHSLHNVNVVAHYLRRENARLTRADRLREHQHDIDDSLTVSAADQNLKRPTNQSS